MVVDYCDDTQRKHGQSASTYTLIHGNIGLREIHDRLHVSMEGFEALLEGVESLISLGSRFLRGRVRKID
jgi:hypothetical protein